MWFKKDKPKPPFSVGAYTLDMSISGVASLTEFTANEYITMGRKFEGEKNFHAPPVKLINNKSEANQIASSTLTFCINQLGNPAQKQTGLFIWDTSNGNVVLQTAEVAEGLSINLFLTSGNLSRFKLL